METESKEDLLWQLEDLKNRLAKAEQLVAVSKQGSVDEILEIKNVELLNINKELKRNKNFIDTPFRKFRIAATF